MRTDPGEARGASWPARLTRQARQATRRRSRESPPLTVAEMRVLRLLPTHLTLAEIGAELHVSRNTVKTHITGIHRKLRCRNRTEAVRRAFQLGLIDYGSDGTFTLPG